MATNYLYGTILTGEAVAANNRGDNLGNTTTLQKVFVRDDVHTTVSAESIRFAIRYRFQLEDLKLNRTYDPSLGKLEYADEKRTSWNSTGEVFIDDDLMGFMDAAAAVAEREDEEPAGEEGASAAEPKTKQKKRKGKTTKRHSPLAIGRAVSLRPYRGELSFNAVSGEKKKGALSLYNAEMHTTEYQYSFGLNLDDVVDKSHIDPLLDAIVDPPQVAGNHSRFAYDFSPASIVLRVTHHHSSRIQNCFEHDEASRGYVVRRLVSKVEAGDIPVADLIIGGEVAISDAGQRLQDLGVFVHKGTSAAMNEARKRISLLGGTFAVVGKGR